jgi:sugar lactone lactonase YvrE
MKKTLLSLFVAVGLLISISPIANGALLESANGISLDAFRNIYVVDQGKGALIKISSGGATVLSTSFLSPEGVAIDLNGNLFVADSDGNCIKKIAKSGAISTFANGFSHPTGIAVDINNNIYVCDGYNAKVKRITSSGVVSTLAGGGPTLFENNYYGGYVDKKGGDARFGYLEGIAVDKSGNVYVCDNGNCAIRKIDSVGNVSTVAGGSYGLQNGQGRSAQFVSPYGICVDTNGYLYVTEGNSYDKNADVRKISPSGVVSTLAKLSDSSWPEGITVDSGGNLFVSDNQSILMIRPNGSFSNLNLNDPLPPISIPSATPTPTPEATTQITFNELPSIISFVFNKKFTLIATAASGATVSFTSSNQSVISVTGNAASVLSKGTTIITAYVSAKGAFPASSYSYSVTVK